MLERRQARIRYLLKSGIKRRVRAYAAIAPGKNASVLREDLARRYLRGDGLEIGALSWPLRVPKGARVRYVDHATREELVRGILFLALPDACFSLDKPRERMTVDHVLRDHRVGPDVWRHDLRKAS